MHLVPSPIFLIDVSHKEKPMEEKPETTKVDEPWERFAALGQAALGAGEIGVRGPGKRVHTTSGDAAAMRYLPHGLETKAGGGGRHPAEVADFAKRQAAQVRHQDFAPKTWLPDCVKDSIVLGDGPEELLKKLIDRVLKYPSEARIMELQGIANELGRSHEGSALVRKLLTRELFHQISQLPCKGEQ
jgi:hypothetical protein